MAELDKVRIQHTHDTAERWDAKGESKPKIGEFIVYDPDYDSTTQTGHQYPRFKIGDGNTTLNALPFATPSAENFNTINGNNIYISEGSSQDIKVGDITAAGNNTLSGSNTFNEAVILKNGVSNGSTAFALPDSGNKLASTSYVDSKISEIYTELEKIDSGEGV